MSFLVQPGPKPEASEVQDHRATATHKGLAVIKIKRLALMVETENLFYYPSLQSVLIV